MDRQLIQRKNRLAFPMIFIGLLLCFVFLCNHMGLGISDYYYFIMLYIVAVIAYAWNSNLYIRFSGQQKAILLLSVLLIFCTLINREYYDSGVFLTYAIWYVFYFAALMMPVTKKDINFFIYSFIVSSVVCCLIVLIARYDYGGGRLSIKIGNHIALDPNFLASFIMIGGALAFERLMNKRKGLIRKLFLLAVVALCTYTIIMTGSRAGVLAFVVCVFGSFVKLFLDNYRKMKLIHYILLIGAIIAALIAMRYILPESIYQRIFHMNLSDGSNSLRVSHWKSALRCWKQQPIFGYGAAMASDVLFEVDNHVGDAHNTYLVILLQFGIFGLALYAYIILDILKGLVNKKNVAYLFLLLGVLMSSFIIANQYSVPLWMPILLFSWISRNYVENKNQKSKMKAQEFQRVVNKY